MTGFVGDIRPEIDWFLVTKAGDIAHFVPTGCWDPVVEPFDELRHRNVRPTIEFPEQFTNGTRLLAQLNPEDLDSCSLGCRSNIACFQVRGNTVGMDDNNISNWREFDNLVISDSKSQPVGSILMEKTWLDKVKHQSHFEFLLLSRSSRVENTVQLDETVFPVNSWCLVNVMLVERQENTVGRLGIGVIHENAWVAADPMSLLFRLKKSGVQLLFCHPSQFQFQYLCIIEILL